MAGKGEYPPTSATLPLFSILKSSLPSSIVKKCRLTIFRILHFTFSTSHLLLSHLWYITITPNSQPLILRGFCPLHLKINKA